MSNGRQGVQGRVSEARHTLLSGLRLAHVAFIIGTGTLMGKLVTKPY